MGGWGEGSCIRQPFNVKGIRILNSTDLLGVSYLDSRSTRQPQNDDESVYAFLARSRISQWPERQVGDSPQTGIPYPRTDPDTH